MISQCAYGKAPTRQLGSILIAVSGVATPENKYIDSKPSSDMQERTRRGIPPNMSCFSRMQLALHATRRTPRGAARLVHAVCAWFVRNVLRLGIVRTRGSMVLRLQLYIKRIPPPRTPPIKTIHGINICLKRCPRSCACVRAFSPPCNKHQTVRPRPRLPSPDPNSPMVLRLRLSMK